jgi:hypothetical protein
MCTALSEPPGWLNCWGEPWIAHHLMKGHFSYNWHYNTEHYVKYIGLRDFRHSIPAPRNTTLWISVSLCIHVNSLENKKGQMIRNPLSPVSVWNTWGGSIGRWEPGGRANLQGSLPPSNNLDLWVSLSSASYISWHHLYSPHLLTHTLVYILTTQINIGIGILQDCQLTKCPIHEMTA